MMKQARRQTLSLWLLNVLLAFVWAAEFLTPVCVCVD